MKKKTMRIIFALLFIIGIVVGYLLPGDVKTLTRKPLKAEIFDVPKKLGQLEMEDKYFKYSILSETESSSLALMRVDGAIPKHVSQKENQLIYINKGKAKVTVGDATSEVGPGQIASIPAGAINSLERIGDTPVEIILFSTPAFAPKEAMYLENK